MRRMKTKIVFSPALNIITKSFIYLKKNNLLKHVSKMDKQEPIDIEYSLQNAKEKVTGR